MSKPKRFVALLGRLAELGITPDRDAIREGRVLVEGRPVLNPNARIAHDAHVVVRERRELRGAIKLRAALTLFDINVSGRVALDVGAATGGFTTALLEAGAARVYAVDVGHGQLLGSLRQDSRVVSLERTNVSDLTSDTVPAEISLVTVDASYLSLSKAVAALTGLSFASGAELIGLIKPMFELGLSAPPAESDLLSLAVTEACRGVEASGWKVSRSVESVVRGHRGAIEFFVHAHATGSA